MTDSPWTFAAESSNVGAGDAVTLVDGTTFVICEPSGAIPGHGARGLFMLDTRVLSLWQLTVNDAPIQALSVAPSGPFSASFVGRIDDPARADASLVVIQRRHVGRGLREDLDIRNHGSESIMVRLRLEVGCDFGALFDVKAGRETTHHGAVVRSEDGALSIEAPSGERGLIESVHIVSSTPRTRVEHNALLWDLWLEPGQRWTNCLLVSITAGGTPIEPSHRCGQPIEDAIPVSRLRQWRDEVTSLETDNATLATAVNRASEDLGALRIFDPDHPERVVVAAGAPWFMTLFGRDSVLTSWMALPLEQDLAQGVLQELADNQGRRTDSATEEQPGRILHEVRFDRTSARLLAGANTYYGTVDATPLFVMLVAELARWTGLTPVISALMPAVDRALEWIETVGDLDGDGFVEYQRASPGGLENQGWKDSWDGIRHQDGSVAAGPIALCEVQGYVYAALRGRAELAAAFDDQETAVAMLERADVLRARFHERFWLADRQWYAIGLDGDKRPIGSLTSNMGHLLWTGIVPADHGPTIAAHLVGDGLFTGWGLRTLASDNPGYNPMSYHCGSVWPHDTALAIAGLARYHCDDEAHRLTAGLLAASAWSGGRLPELFAGFAADDLASPVPYPASCSPQAWAAASPLLLVRSMLGLEPNLLTGHLRLRPRLPPGVHRLALSGVPIGGSRLDITVTEEGVDLQGMPDHLVLEIDRR